ncbi:hypothetical protein [Methanocaldococcus sp.]|nr:hypothetical protein [Methanocaldococcus sp.]
MDEYTLSMINLRMILEQLSKAKELIDEGLEIVDNILPRREGH